MDFDQVYQAIIAWLTTVGLRVLLVVVLALIAVKAVRIFSDRISRMFGKSMMDEEYKKRAATLGAVIRNLLNVIVIIVAFITVLGQLGVEIGPVLAAAGIVGLAVGFGAQTLVKDVINGFFILLNDQIRVGDVVNIAGKGGLVEKVNLKMTVLRDLSGTVHYIPNGSIDVVSNMTKEYSQYVFDIGVAYREDTDEVIEVIKAVDEELRNDPEFKDDILEPIEILGVDQFAESAVIIKARTKTRPIKQWRIGREFNRRLKKAFDARDIEIPFPHVTLYMGKDKDGSAPPLRVTTEKGTQSAKS